MSAAEIALALAEAGWPTFPCNGNKKPSISKQEGGRGFRDASLDPDAIRRMFSRRNAVLVGVPTGEASGFDVLDIDPRHGGHLWEAANHHRLPETRIHESMSGGRHWIFVHAPGVRNSAGKKGMAPGVDVRGQGGYIIMPPSPGYRVISDAPIAHWPDWLLQPGIVLPPPQEERPAPSGRNVEVSHAQLQAIVDRALDRVRRAADGQKHYALRNMALLLGGIADRAGLSDAHLIERLLQALPVGVKDWRVAEKTAAWGVANGRRNPLDIVPAEAEKRAADPRRKALARLLFGLVRMQAQQADIEAAAFAEGERLGLTRTEVCDTAAWVASQARRRPAA